MPNSRLKKNPLMSLWLSGANAVAGSVRGRVAGEARRQATTAMARATRDAVDFWTGAWAVPGAKKRGKRR